MIISSFYQALHYKLLTMTSFSTRFAGSGYPAFIVSLIFIGILTAVVEQVASLLGCVWGIKQSVSGITLVALGTSLPDTFASRSAAMHDESADAAIGNVTGNVGQWSFVIFLTAVVLHV